MELVNKGCRKIKELALLLAHNFIYFYGFLSLHSVHRGLLKKDIWLIKEKDNEARDNGYHLYRFLRENYPELEVYYVINDDAPDYAKIVPYGNAIKTNSFKHLLYYLACHYSINSQAYGAYPYKVSKDFLKSKKKICNENQKVVFLQHGISKDELSHDYFDHDKANIDLFITSAEREYRFIKSKYNYSGKSISCTGLCRFDNLVDNNDRKQIVLIMPTWRTWLGTSDPTIPATDEELKEFKKSVFFNEYAGIMRSEKIAELLDKQNYKIVFYMHYQIQKYSKAFFELENKNVIIAEKELYDVQELLKQAAVLITDYSSVFFDFAYMKKPLLYFQFDEERFFKGHYQKGYFSYYEDGYGPVCHNQSEVVEYISKLFFADLEMENRYVERVDSFFAYNDSNNCQRVYEAIMSLENEDE